MSEIRTFDCVIEDRHLHDRFSANVTISKRAPVRRDTTKGAIELADFFIAPISAQPFSGEVHNHFILYDFTGHGKYVVRDRYGRTIDKRECSIWDLGQHFAIRVMEELKELP